MSDDVGRTGRRPTIRAAPTAGAGPGSIGAPRPHVRHEPPCRACGYPLMPSDRGRCPRCHTARTAP